MSQLVKDLNQYHKGMSAFQDGHSDTAPGSWKKSIMWHKGYRAMKAAVVETALKEIEKGLKK